MKRKYLLICILLVTFVTIGFVGYSESEYFLKIYRGIDIFTRVYKEVALNYVDEVDPERFVRAGIEGMLKTLDPYTVYIAENEKDEIDLLTTGKYGGIGVTIGLRDGAIVILNLMEGYSAAKQGMQVGDKILEVDGTPVKGKSLENVRMMVRGAPGTEVKIKVEREGERAPLEFSLIREEILVRNVTYVGFVSTGIGYIKLERFSRTAGEDIRNAIKELKAKGDLKGIILDLRGNPGGLLEMAVEVVSVFVPESSLIVTTRGRKSDSERKYYSTTKPLVPDIPLAVLVNRNSASASEIVAGAIQDLDRGIIVGTRTFGKGLVQTITQLSNNASLKITTARYYTPSGRCIQEIDYLHRTEDGKVTVIPDSVRQQYYTKGHRAVQEAGGIQPDTVVVDSVQNPFIEELSRQGMFFKFVNHFVSSNHLTGDSTISMTSEIIRLFEAFTKEKGFTYKSKDESLLEELKKSSREYSTKEVVQTVLRLDSLLQNEKGNLFRKYQKELSTILQIEFAYRLKGERARIEAELPTDEQFRVAHSLLKNAKQYHALLQGE
ncbi:MAG: S41 family peptidase [Bacteroidetes bacterium]|nr:S41 family peptidase [Bacteroidota bacterium]